MNRRTPPQIDLRKINQQLCDVLGIPWQGTRLTGFTLDVNHSELPQLTLRSFVLQPAPGPVVKNFEWRAIDPADAAPVDLNAMAQAARERVAAHIESRAEVHLRAIKGSFVRAYSRMRIVEAAR